MVARTISDAYPRPPDPTVFRNRLAHHQRVWSHAPDERYEDLLALAGYIDPALPGWIAATSRVPQTLSAKP
jgi:hypothetical protein